MRMLLNAFYTKPLALYLILSLIAISTFAGPPDAMLLPTASAPRQAAPSPARFADILKDQRVLEMKAVQQRLQDHGLTPEEAAMKMNALSDEQLHEFAVNMDAIQAGGQGNVGGGLEAIGIIALLLAILLYLYLFFYLDKPDRSGTTSSGGERGHT